MKPAVPQDAHVVIHHLRRFEGVDGLLTRRGARVRGVKTPPLPKGGLTLVQVEFADGSVARGSAQCSVLDNFNRSKGRMIAVGRALKLAKRGLDVPYHEHVASIQGVPLS